MAAYTATDWVVTSSDVKFFREQPYRRVALMTLNSGASTYPNNGIPIPVAAKFGMRVLQSMVPMTAMATPTGGDDVICNYDNTNRTIRMFRLSTTSDAAPTWAELATTESAGASALYVEVLGH